MRERLPVVMGWQADVLGTARTVHHDGLIQVETRLRRSGGYRCWSDFLSTTDALSSGRRHGVAAGPLRTPADDG